MRTVLKPFAVLTLTSCLTTLQFSTLAWAQDQTSLKTTPTAAAKSSPLKVELATPSMLFAPANGFQVDLGYSRTQHEFQYKNVTGVADGAEDAVATEVGYGFKDMLFISSQIQYKSEKTKADMALAGLTAASIQQTTVEGVGDPVLKVGGRLNVGELSAVGSVGYMIPSGTSERQVKANQDTEVNAKNGGAEIRPSLSVFRNDKSGIVFGGTAEYIVRQERKLNSKEFNGFATEMKETGGNSTIMSAFFETPQTTHSVGAVMAYQKDASVRRESALSVEVAGSETVTGTLYGNIRATKKFSIIPSASYRYYVNDKFNETELSKQTVYGGAVNVRLMF